VVALAGLELTPLALALVAAAVAAGTALIVLRAGGRGRASMSRLALVGSAYLVGGESVPGRVPGRNASLLRPAVPRWMAAMLGVPSIRQRTDGRTWVFHAALGLCSGTLVVGYVYLLAGLPFFAAAPAGVVAAALTVRWLFVRAHRARQALHSAQFPDALGMVVRAVRAGLPPTEAIRAAISELPEPTHGEFARVCDEVALGFSFEAALWNFAERVDLPEHRFFAVAVTLQQTTGGGLGETLEGLADTIRKRSAVRQRAYALATEARLSAVIIGLIPVVTALMLLAVAPEYILMFLFDPTGRMILAIAIALMACGIIAMRLTVRRSLGR
jgi:tight adherence protein B